MSHHAWLSLEVLSWESLISRTDTCRHVLDVVVYSYLGVSSRELLFYPFFTPDEKLQTLLTLNWGGFLSSLRVSWSPQNLVSLKVIWA